MATSGSFKKGEGAPVRPPPPKVGGMMSFSFKALEEEEDDELSMVTRMSDRGKGEGKVGEPKEKREDIDRARTQSKSPEPLVQSKEAVLSSSPSSMKSHYSFEKLMDIKEKLVKKTDSLSESFRNKDKTGVGPKDLYASQSVQKSIPESGQKSKPEETVRNDELHAVDSKQTEKDVKTNTKFISYEKEWTVDVQNKAEELETTEEYFDPTYEDFSGLPQVDLLRKRKAEPNLRNIKPEVPSSPVAMSKFSPQTVEKDNIVEKEMQSASKIHFETGLSESSKQVGTVQIRNTNIPVKKISISAVVLLLCVILPLPSFLSGLITGTLLASVGWFLFLWITEPAKPREPILEDPPLEELPPMLMPEIREPKADESFYKGWMNELGEYNPATYSINQTHSIYIDLERSTLRLRRPKVNVLKRAMWDEPSHNPQFIHQRHFDIEGSKVFLVPAGLVKKRLWSKKYPICIAIGKTNHRQNARSDSAPQSPVSSTLVPGMKMSTSHSSDSVNGFEVVNETACDSFVLYLFARTCQEKEQWFRRFLAAAKGSPLKNNVLEIKNLVETFNMKHTRNSSTDSLKFGNRQSSSDSLSSISSNVTGEQVPGSFDLNAFVIYMTRLMPRTTASSVPSSPTHSVSGKDKEPLSREKGSPAPGSGGSKSIVCDPALLPLNAVIGRCFYDFLGDKYWAEKVKDKLQKKLSKIHIPYFIEDLKISEICLGREVPVIRRAAKPYLDENGFWVDLDITYSGKFKMTIETKVNLLRLKQPPPAPKPVVEKQDKSAVTNSDEEDSAESSTDEDEETASVNEEGQSGGTGKKLLKYINKITSSKYFQSATEYKFIKKAMTEVSNTRLILTVELQKLSGTLALNIPCPPSDRLWYGFRGNPQLWLVAKPKVGEREVTMTHITDWIEKKLALEFQHVFVMPNMDDLVVPILSAGPEVEEHTAMPQPAQGSEV
ncbi:testis-expressed protein 2-like [Dreissena polymorpha]|uniref:SMP-LTD domain-containing protein n=1 Tax=Dreissena polymorpha TaxID=45954 RepID=A0A9D4LRA0_DREPO|nr:testis-expressed protein 2-like [Dreissena polymorpha]XP_052262630.1 testis-expressed protein 2-like [Dreissena polymorpha]XP_052262631.1 testis-expressed protein 2-like [Dreissena polymorpha]KAH3862429.1 hypothetical protein DPMN_025396 [Dreissena polymorpha]